ncbi:MAG: TonB-dependent receptor [Thermoanaerobaculia bacterium]
MLRLRIATLMAAVALFVLSAAPAPAQPSTGKIIGTVRDANGVPVPGVPITIKNQATGATRVVRSLDTGAFEADLPPGVYTVTANPQGFLSVTHRDQRVEAGATSTLDLTLEVRVAEEVTVTAMKREETVHNTPESIAVQTQEDLQQKGIGTFEELAANTANVSVQNLGPGQSQVSIRGVSSGQIARDQPGPKEEVGIYLDESPISFLLFTPDLDLFDMNRVELLRGPQGTLFGSGSLSGTVRYISNQPALGETLFFGEATGSSISGGNQGGEVKVGINSPLGDKAAARVAAYFDRFAGYMDAVQPDLSVNKNVNTGERGGVRAAVELIPTDNLTITPRFFYQHQKMNGWNRVDLYNILANPYTTTRPDVTLGDRQLFTQVGEPMTDNFYLGDVNISYNFGNMVLTSITSYTYRDILVVRDAGALTSSITGGSIGLPENVYTLNAPLNDATTAQGWTQEVRLSGGNDRLKWVGGGFYSTSRKAYGQDLLVAGFTELSGVPSQGLRAPEDHLFFSDLDYRTQQFAFFGEGTYSFTPQFNFTAGLRYYNFKDKKQQIFDGIFGNNDTGTSLVENRGTTKADGVAPRFIATYRVSDSTNLNAQVSKGFRLGGINDPLNVPLCTADDLVTFGGRSGFSDETAWNYEIGSKSRIFGGRGYVNASAFYIDIHDLQAVVTAGSCSSRLVFSVPKARSVGGELEFGMVVNQNFDFAVSTGYNDATLRSTVTSTDSHGVATIVSGIRDGARLPSVPKFQLAAAATYQRPVMEGVTGYLTGTYQHIGSRYTQVGDDVPGFGTVPLLPSNGGLPHTIGGPLTQSTFVFDPLLPAYDILNFRLGTRFSNFDVAFFVNNVTDEQARLALDRERGLLARVGYLTNQPRTFGLTARTFF